MNKEEILLLVISVIIIFLIQVKNRFGLKRSLLISLSIIPVLYICINMVSEIVTIDEWGYMNAIINMDTISVTIPNNKMMYQYRTMQVLMGTFFSILPTSMKVNIAMENLVRLYKIVHWLYCFVIIEMIIHLVHRNLISKKIQENIWENSLVSIILHYVILTLPVSCLIIKVCNYDSFSVYFSVLAITLTLVGILKKNLKILFGAVLISCIGCMEKMSASPYFFIILVIYIYYVLVNNKDVFIKQVICTIIKAVECVSLALILSIGNLAYIKIFLANGKLSDQIRFEYVAFPYTAFIQQVFEEGFHVQSDHYIRYLFILLTGIIITSIAMYYFFYYVKKLPKYIISKICKVVFVTSLILFIGASIYTSYYLPERIAPWNEIENGKYISNDTANGVVFHFGADTKFQHIIFKIMYHYAVVFNGIPTIYLLLFCICIITTIKIKNIDYDWTYHIYFEIVLILIGVFAFAGQPAVLRYYATNNIIIIMLLTVLGINSLEKWSGITTKGAIRIKESVNIVIYTFFFILGLISEVLIYSPNICIFSPIWNIHSKEYKTTIRTGYWHAGEAMSWGEEIAIAGNQIKEYAKNENIYDITIYSNYGLNWLTNPGYKIFGTNQITNGEVEPLWNNNEYFVLTKFNLYRKEIPSFIYDIEPILKISYNGEISTWIYTGDQLKKYNQYFK